MKSTLAHTEALARARQSINKRFPGAMQILSGTSEVIENIPTGIFLLDAALGIGGIPLGRIGEAYGKPSVGKSTAMQVAGAAFQRSGRPVIWFDYEHSFDKKYAKLCGMNFDENLFTLVQPETMEDGLHIIETIIEAEIGGLIIVDSLAAMVPRVVLEADPEKSHVGVKARLMSQTMQRLTGRIDRTGTTLIFINHLQEQINSFAASKGITMWTTPGGNALKFYSSFRLEFKQAEQTVGKTPDFVSGRTVEQKILSRVTITVTKNKLGPPLNVAYMHLRRGQGISEVDTVIDVAEQRGLIKRNSSRYILPFTKPNSPDFVNLNGLQQTVDWMLDHPEQYEIMKNKLISLVNEPIMPRNVQSNVEEISDVKNNSDNIIEEEITMADII